MPYKDPKKNKACQKAYRDKNKEKIKKYDKEYREKNKERIKAYRDRNKERKSAYDKEYGKEYREKHKDRIKEYMKNNREKKAIYARDYYSKNREIVSDKNNHYIFEKNTISREAAFNHRKEWTPEDIEILIHMIKQGKSYKEISTRLGRTIQSIATRLYQLRKQGDSFNGNPVDI